MKYCQGPSCHEYKTKDRIRGSKGDKHYETRKRSSFYYLNGNACSTICQNDWFVKFGDMAVDHFGRIHEPKRTDCDQAWYKDYKWISCFYFICHIVILLNLISAVKKKTRRALARRVARTAPRSGAIIS